MLGRSLECHEHLYRREQRTLTLTLTSSSIVAYCARHAFLIAGRLICCMLAACYSEDAWETVKQVRLNNPRAGAHRCNIN